MRLPLLGDKKAVSPRGPQVRETDTETDVAIEGKTPTPQPERHEPELRDPGLTDLSKRDYKAVVIRAGKEALDDQITDLAAALAYYSFLAIPSILLVALGVFSVFADESAVQSLIDRVGRVAPPEATALLEDSLTRMTQNSSGGLVMAIVGFLLGLWTTTGAMTAFMRALNRAYDRKETRGFVRQRIVAILMVAIMLVAFALVFGLLVMGPALSGWIGDAVGLEAVLKWVWWLAQWPVLIVGLLLAFATVLYLGPNVEHPKWHFVTPGSVFAVVVWLLVSGLFAVYTAMFASYNKAWGSLAAVIIMLTWLWLTGLALLVGAEINAEAERSRELREGQPAERQIQAPTKA
ncbi:MAG: YihY/virulence factor BrkB family protein [Gaiellales bacterium]